MVNRDCNGYLNGKRRLNNGHVLATKNLKNLNSKLFFSILDMIAQKPMNIFALIDEESSLNYTTDDTMLNKLKSIHGNNDLFEVTRQGTEVFFIKHFAGDVCYTVDGMLEKNRDTFHTDSLNVIGGSTNKFLAYLFNKEIKDWLHN